MSSGGDRAPTILIVDDLADIRELERMVLSREGFDVVAEAGDGGEAVTVAEQHRPDIVVLDVNMPGISGLDALPLIRIASPDSRIVLFSSTGPEGRTEAIMLGADAYLDKTELHDLAATIRRVMEHSGVRSTRR